jgi:hypothetical protein
MMGLLNKRIRVALLACAAVAGTATLPSIASAGDNGGRFHDARSNDSRDDRSRRDDQRSDERRRDYDNGGDHDRDRDRSHTDVRIDINLGRPRYEPVYEERTTRVWVEPTYRTVCDRVWVQPIYRTDCDRVWEPDRFAYRDVVYRDHGRRVIRQERVLVEPGHWEYRTERVQVGERRADANSPFGDLFASLSR